MMKAEICPWYVSAHAVRRYQELAAAAPPDFDDASDELITACAAVWARYQGNLDLAPEVSRSGGAYIYRGPRPLCLRVLVSMAERSEGAKPQVVDVVGAENVHSDAKRRKNARRKQQRERAAARKTE